MATHAYTTRTRTRRTSPPAVNIPTTEQQGVPINPDDLPDIYGMIVSGDCLAPEIAHGTVMKFSKTAPYAPGDFVVLYRRPELVKEGGFQGIVKRLVLTPPHWVTFPYRENPKSEVRALIVAEQLNPRRQYAIPCEDLLAVHKCLGPCTPEELGR